MKAFEKFLAKILADSATSTRPIFIVFAFRHAFRLISSSICDYRNSTVPYLVGILIQNENSDLTSMVEHTSNFSLL